MSRIALSLILALLTISCSVVGFLRLDINTDVIRSLPAGDVIIANGLTVFENHPMHDRIAVDVMHSGGDVALLAKACTLLEQHLADSGLFSQVGSSSFGDVLPGLATHAAENLPLLFSARELEQQVAPLLTDEAIHQRINALRRDLATMEGVGQARFATIDPLGLKDLVMARLAPLAPSLNAQLYQGRLLSADHKHMLVTARPHTAGTDTAAAHDLTRVIDQAAAEIKAQLGDHNDWVTLTPVGAYRAALDNEQIIRHDVSFALLLATAGIGVLLLVSFPRPLIGLLSLVPAFAGMGIALFVYSLFNESISIMVLGFGSAIISITVDHGVTYLLFLDRERETNGQEASREVLSVGIMAVITSIGAFLILAGSGFPIFTELGRFTALGIFFSYVFVHWVFPRLFPSLKSAGRKMLPMKSFVSLLSGTGKAGALIALALAAVFCIIARPQFHVSLSSMNTVSDSTLAAEELFTAVWGDINKRIYFLGTGQTVKELQHTNDRLLESIENDTRHKILQSTFVPSMLFPGRERSDSNLEAWQRFWSPERRQQVAAALRSAAIASGFTDDAFLPFSETFSPLASLQYQEIPPQYFELFGISAAPDGLIQYIGMNPGENYESRTFFSRYSELGNLFDVDLFTDRLAQLLFTTFTQILVIIACSVAVLLFVFYLDLRLTLLTLLPPLFAYICTLGTLHLLDRPLDIPSLMLSIVILGMGVDYSIFCVRAHQRYRDPAHPSYTLVHLAVFIAGSSTIIGFGVLCLAEHSLLQSIGLTSLLGIGYSLLGTFLLLPPLLARYLGKGHISEKSCIDVEERIRCRYRTLEAYPRMFARFKLRYDPLFQDLAKLLPSQRNIKNIVDIGCGYGVPACWCLEHFPHARVYGLEPDPERVRVATFAFHGRGSVRHGFAPELPEVSEAADVVLLLDMIHYLDDKTLRSLLKNCSNILHPDGLLITRFVIQPQRRPSLSWMFEDLRIRLGGGKATYRSREEVAELMEQAGLSVCDSKVSKTNPELVWMSCQVSRKYDAGAL